MVKYGQYMVKCGQIWSNVGKYGQIYGKMVKYGQIWAFSSGKF